MLDIASIINSASTGELKLILAGVEKRLAELGDMPPANPSASPSVPEGVKHLTRDELDMATDTFSSWCLEAKTPMQIRSRNRIWIAFLLIRYGAMRLGEVLTLDERKDFRTESCEVLVRGSHARRLPLPEPVMRKIGKLLASPLFHGIRGQVLALDQGYVRRKFYERAKACGLSSSLFNPRVIRHSRAIELLRGGVPLQVVRSFMGQQNAPLAAGYPEFSGESAQRIVQQYINREIKMKTSARNAFTGKVTNIIRDGLLVEVELTTMTGLRIVSVITEASFANLRLAEGSVATATVKAPWVILTEPGDRLRTSARNAFFGTISEVKTSEIACEVIVALSDGNSVCALLTRDSAQKLNLTPEKEIVAMFKAFAVILNVE